MKEERIFSREWKLKKLEKQAQEILDLVEVVSRYKDEELVAQTEVFKNILRDGGTLDGILNKAFAVVIEAIYRVYDKKLYKVQVIGAIALHQGRVIEMKTGEGKTLTEICPAYLNALTGGGVHILTVNDYLAQRDKEESSKVLEWLGISVGLITAKSTGPQRYLEYRKDVLYTTNVEIGFDYLRDSIAKNLNEKVQRELNYIIIDEIDSVLIDDARTPLILSKDTNVNEGLCFKAKEFIDELVDDDVEIHYKDKAVLLKWNGILKLEKKFCIDNISSIENSELNHVIKQGLLAKYIYIKDKNYIVEDDTVILIDDYTGRIAKGRKLSDGLHQSIEVKEGVSITPDTNTIATITYQNLFKLYRKISGMSGTVLTEELEFQEFYSLDVLAIPTNKAIKRRDLKDIICIDEDERLKKIYDDVTESIKIGQPVLVATQTIKKSEQVAKYLQDKGVDINLLTAKNKKEEAEIIKVAGQKGKITIATNIAGRGTDIKISDEVNKIGGLKVVGVERSFSKRVDNQLIGRAGRQGNKGCSRFYITGEDDLFKEHAPRHVFEKLEKMLNENKFDEKKVRKAIKKAQTFYESRGIENRREIVKHDEIIHKHRILIYEEREKVIEGIDLGNYLADCIVERISNIVDGNLKNVLSKEDLKNLYYNISKELSEAFNFEYNSSLIEGNLNRDDIINICINEITRIYNDSVTKINRDISSEIKGVLLEVIDKAWIQHIEEMQALRRDSTVETYMQKDPYVIYRFESRKRYEEMISRIQNEFVKNIFRTFVKKNNLCEKAK
ncbi:MAG: helicase-related protein [Sarcina sp.]